jgi:uncharacterized protein (DUF983 family)
MDLNCPYCQTAFPKFPSRKTKCQACGQVVYPKRRIEDPAARFNVELAENIKTN